MMLFFSAMLGVIACVSLVAILISREEKRWYYIVYRCPTFKADSTAGIGVTAEQMSPAEWSIKASLEHDDGPYLILYAEAITKEQADIVNGHLA